MRIAIVIVFPFVVSGCWSKLMGETAGTRSGGALGEPCDDPPSIGGASAVVCGAGLACKNKVCAAGGVGSTPVTLAAGQGFPADIAVDASNVYWISQGAGGSGFVLQLPKAGGTVPVQVANGQPSPTCIAVDKTSVYWTAEGMGAGGVVRKAPIGGGTPTTLAENQKIPNNPGCIKVDGKNVYWTNGASGLSGAPEVLRCATSGCGKSPTAIASTTDLSSAAQGLAIDDHAAYWIEDGGGVKSVPLDGGPVILLASAQASGQGGFGIAVDATSVYWPAETHQVQKCSKTDCSGGPMGLASIAGGSTPNGIAIDDANVYWAGGGAGIMKLPKNGGTATAVVSSDVGFVLALAVDADNVYFTTIGGNVMVVSK